ncbi:ThiF family adenylyltransferase [Granulicella sp. S190]|uniref:ThiF family adenylyltransferase n=1 Tax=Granulicella sp. S190 TaxID=1747226 RepID=UPI00131CA28C
MRRVMLVGIGALGSELAIKLGLLGCEQVFIADADLLEEKNICRSELWSDTVPGMPKVITALPCLRARFPATRWEGASVEIADVDPVRFAESDILFSCVDTDLARTEIAAIAGHYVLPVCDAGVGGTSTQLGRVSWFPHERSAACFACLLSSRRRASLLSAWESDVHACWSEETEERSSWTSAARMTSLVSSLQIDVAVSTSTSKCDAFSIHLDLDRQEIAEKIRHSRSDVCPLHDELSGELFPVCTRAACIACGAQFFPQRRVGWVRRWGSCPACGAGSLLIKESRHDFAESAV